MGIPPATPRRPTGGHRRLPRVFYGAILLQIIALSLLFTGGSRGLYVSTFLQSILCWSVVVIIYVDFRLRAAARGSEVDWEGEGREPGTGLYFYHSLLARLEQEKEKNDSRGGSTSVLQIHLGDPGESSRGRVASTGEPALRELETTLRKVAGGPVMLGRAGAHDLLAVLPGTDRRRARSIARRLRKRFSRGDAADGGRDGGAFGVPAIAVATYPADGGTTGHLLAAANRPFTGSCDEAAARAGSGAAPGKG